MKSLRALLTVMLLLALPLQGIAAYAPAIACADGHADGRSEHKHAAHEGSAHDHQHDNETAPAEPVAGHTCCHHVVSAPASILVANIPEAARTLLPRISLLITLFIPEPPARPPRA